MQTVNDLITRAVKRQGKNFAGVARAVGMNRTHVSMIAAGKRRLTVASAIAIGTELDIPPRRLLVAQLDAELAEATEAPAP